jgi:hypothetical protein
MATTHPPTLRIVACCAASAAANRIFNGSMSLKAHLAFSSAASRSVAGCSSTGGIIEHSDKEKERWKVVDHVVGF